MRYVFVFIVLLVVSQASAQLLARVDEKKSAAAVEPVAEWSEGSILFTDGTEAKGLVKYNHYTDLVSFQSDSRSGSYHARNLAGFKLHNIQRQFYSIPYQSPHGIVKRFFELVREYKDFAVISRTSMLLSNTSSELTTLYFLRASDGSVMPYLEVLAREVKWRVFDANKTQIRVLDSNLPQLIMGEHFDKVKAFAKERKLVWHVRGSLLSILDYYDSLMH